MSLRGGSSTDAVPSDHGFLKSSRTWSSSTIVRRSLAGGGRRMYLHSARRPCLSLAATLGIANTLLTSVLDRVRELGLLSALGLTHVRTAGPGTGRERVGVMLAHGARHRFHDFGRRRGGGSVVEIDGHGERMAYIGRACRLAITWACSSFVMP